jgi:hypothetical protein
MRRVFAKRVVNAVLPKIGDVFPDQPPQVPFVQRDHVVQPDTPQGSPEQLVQRIQPGPRLFRLKHSDLLPQGEDF